MSDFRRMMADAMGEALHEGALAGARGEVPVGAVVVDAAGRVVGRGANRREADGDVFAHAEIDAMRMASACLRSRYSHAPDSDSDAARGSVSDSELRSRFRSSAWNLADCTLVVTLEPCPMCAGAALQAHIGRIVFGAWDAKMGACGSVWDIPRDPHVGAVPEVYGGVRESECAVLLREFFTARRG